VQFPVFFKIILAVFPVFFGDIKRVCVSISVVLNRWCRKHGATLHRLSLLGQKGKAFNLWVAGHVVLLFSTAYLTTLSQFYTVWRLMVRWNNEIQNVAGTCQYLV
jgi:hypothetical protein